MNQYVRLEYSIPHGSPQISIGDLTVVSQQKLIHLWLLKTKKLLVASGNHP